MVSQNGTLYILNRPYDADADYLIERLGWQKLDIQRTHHTTVMVYKSINSLAPGYLSNLPENTVKMRNTP